MSTWMAICMTIGVVMVFGPARSASRPWATRVRGAVVLAATWTAYLATGHGRHWPALAGGTAVMLLAACVWLTRRW